MSADRTDEVIQLIDTTLARHAAGGAGRGASIAYEIVDEASGWIERNLGVELTGWQREVLGTLWRAPVPPKS